MEAVPGPSHPIRVLYRHYNCGITVGKMPSRKADQFTLDSTDSVHGQFLNVAISLCNKIYFSMYISGQLYIAIRL